MEVFEVGVVLIWIDGSDIVAEGKSQDQVSNNIVLIAAIPTFAPALVGDRPGEIVAFIDSVALVRTRLAVGSLRNLAAVVQLVFHFRDVILSILCEFHRYLLENHVILGQSASFV